MSRLFKCLFKGGGIFPKKVNDEQSSIRTSASNYKKRLPLKRGPF